VGPGHVELELGAEGGQAEQAARQRIALLEPRELRFELGDSLPGPGKLSGHTFPIPRTHLGLSIGWRVTVLEHADAGLRAGAGRP
jgi:hypothetical protein